MTTYSAPTIFFSTVKTIYRIKHDWPKTIPILYFLPDRKYIAHEPYVPKYVIIFILFYVILYSMIFIYHIFVLYNIYILCVYYKVYQRLIWRIKKKNDLFLKHIYFLLIQTKLDSTTT